MHKQPIPPLKQVDNEEDDVKTENTKNILPLILDGITTAKEPTTNTNEELELEEKIEVVEMTNTTKKQSITSSHDIGTEENIEIQITNINAETIKNSIKDISEKVFQNFTFYFQIGQIFRKKSNLNENPKVNHFDLRAFSEYNLLSKEEMIQKVYALGFRSIPYKIYSDKKFVLLNDLLMFSFIYNDKIELSLKKNYALYVFFLFEVIMVQLEKKIQTEFNSTISYMGTSEKKKNTL
ncbi:hypothetical protein CWI37_0517p0010 [Hamiltosporidium tvaerminnensis]|uniref:Uncharacterized protein n=2 Tax=Hamiltosporidium TaxID=1176354 RepID=A0A4Q9L569_9MICR|nr:hypothetical protein CWI37_0517p0010 [Hamiltosporidium tvaerminnensis]